MVRLHCGEHSVDVPDVELRELPTLSETLDDLLYQGDAESGVPVAPEAWGQLLRVALPYARCAAMAGGMDDYVLPPGDGGGFEAVDEEGGTSVDWEWLKGDDRDADGNVGRKVLAYFGVPGRLLVETYTLRELHRRARTFEKMLATLKPRNL
jgi:hypothetical protein